MWSEQIAGPLADEHAHELRAAARAAGGQNGGRSGMRTRLWDRLTSGRTGSAVEDAAMAAAGLDRVTIRRSRAADRRALERLAQLDSRRLAAGELLVAEVDGELRAALPLGGGAPIADPFRPTAPLVSLLMLRARQVSAADAVRSAPAPVKATARSAAAGR
jgi:hypothetical protein